MRNASNNTWSSEVEKEINERAKIGRFFINFVGGKTRISTRCSPFPSPRKEIN
jgi:hypothetical protein